MSDLRTAFTVTAPGTDQLLDHRGRELAGPHESFGQLDHGIWDLTRPERRLGLDRFAAQYALVRAAEQRDMSAAAIRRLPEIDESHPLSTMWQSRAASYRAFRRAITDLAPKTMIDIGAGCGWLAARMADDGWTAAALDITVDGGDGLAAARHHQASLLLARAEMEALPFASNSVELAVFNASLHYAASTTAALNEACRVLTPTGTLVVLDSPIFVDLDAGHQSTAEFAAHLEQTHNLEPAEYAGLGFLSQAEVNAFAHRVQHDWCNADRPAGIRAAFHRRRGARRAGRETAGRPLLLMSLGEPT